MAEGSGDRERTRRRLELAAVLAVVVAAFVVDYNLSEDELALDDRSWGYLVALTVGFLGVAARSVRDGASRSDVAADLGVSGVLILLLAVVVHLETRSDLEGIEMPPPGRLLLVSAVLWIAAALGALSGRNDALEVHGEPSAPPRPLALFAYAGLGLTALCVVLTLTQFHDPPGCEEVPRWRELTVVAIGLMAIGAAMFGVASLLARRWFVALVCIAVPAIAFFFASLLNACLS